MVTAKERGCPASKTRNHHRFQSRLRFLPVIVTVTAIVLTLSFTTRLVAGFNFNSQSPQQQQQRVRFRELSRPLPLPRSQSVSLFVEAEPPPTAEQTDIPYGTTDEANAITRGIEIKRQENDDTDNSNSNDDNDNNELESRVIVSIKNVASSASNITQDPNDFFSALGEFGKSSGALIGQKWLTPESLEECLLFWDDGYRALMRDLFRSYVFSSESTRYKFNDWVALGWFLVLASSSSLIFFPLLLPLIHVALQDVGGENGIDESIYVPPSFRAPRLAAMRRLRRPNEQPLSNYLTNGTPRNIREGISFFKDGTLLLARDLQRGALTQRKEDTLGSYGWFAFLAFSSFPITPLIIPLIDKRRTGETSDYVPSSYRPERLKALARLREIEAVKFGTTPIETLRAVAFAVASNKDKDGDSDSNTGLLRPPPEMLLGAILKAQREGITQDKSVFLEHLAGVPGRRWELAYVAGKPALMAMRKQLAKKEDGDSTTTTTSEDNDGMSGSESWYRPLERLVLPWTRLRDGLYIDSNLVSAIQNFDVETMQNKNGVFQILGSDFFQTTVEGPFSWDGDCQIVRNRDADDDNDDDRGTPNRKRNTNAAVCAFRPTTATFQIGPWWTIDQDIPEETPFDETHIRDLPFFKFIHVDDRVAVAMGRSGSVALWTRMAE